MKHNNFIATLFRLTVLKKRRQNNEELQQEGRRKAVIYHPINNAHQDKQKVCRQPFG